MSIFIIHMHRRVSDTPRSLSTQVSCHPAQANEGLMETASIVVGHTIGGVFVADESMSSATPGLLGAFMMFTFLFTSAFLFAKVSYVRVQVISLLRPILSPRAS